MLFRPIQELSSRDGSSWSSLQYRTCSIGTDGQTLLLRLPPSCSHTLLRSVEHTCDRKYYDYCHDSGQHVWIQPCPFAWDAAAAADDAAAAAAAAALERGVELCSPISPSSPVAPI